MLASLTTHWKDLVVTFFMSMLPLVELRGGILFAAAKGIPFPLAAATSFFANILPLPFILLFLRRFFRFLEHFGQTRRLVNWLENKARKKVSKMRTAILLGLFLFVAIPLPGTGVWTGALIAVVFDLQIKKAFPVIAAGALCALCVMSVMSYLIPGFFGFVVSS
ncbi:MAG: small multi-drug export protein [Oscillospiraceae bacterium]|jgi:uncharacterized membrane protein|nr:small multi-drug export protein [Oscillospiraceae bacterium]